MGQYFLDRRYKYKAVVRRAKDEISQGACKTPLEDINQGGQCEILNPRPPKIAFIQRALGIFCPAYI